MTNPDPTLVLVLAITAWLGLTALIAYIAHRWITKDDRNA